MASTCAVQRVTKASSDQLLRKFAAVDPETPHKARRPIGGPLRPRKSRRVASGLGARDTSAAKAGATDAETVVTKRRSGSMAEWKTLLPGATSRPRPASRRTSIRRPAGLPTNKVAGMGFLLAALEKTWRNTIGGASKVLLEKKPCSIHVRLTSDIA